MPCMSSKKPITGGRLCSFLLVRKRSPILSPNNLRVCSGLRLFNWHEFLIYMPTRIACKYLYGNNGFFSIRGEQGGNFSKQKSGSECGFATLITLYSISLFQTNWDINCLFHIHATPRLFCFCCRFDRSNAENLNIKIQVFPSHWMVEIDNHCFLFYFMQTTN